MKPIIAVDFKGALLRYRPFIEADKKWFYVMSILLKDESIKGYYALEDYYGKVKEIMEKLLGDVDKKTRTVFAREFFSMLLVSEVNQKDLAVDFAEYLRKIKDKYSLILITSAPEACVEAMLQKLGCSDIFDSLYKSPMQRYPNKKELFKEFIKTHTKPDFYIGEGDKDMPALKDLGIKTISVNWIKKGEYRGDFDVDSVEDLKKILNPK
jgi:FMN phosphatase YigB (HAD superfamily)